MARNPYCLIVVRRGETEVFERLQAEFSEKSDVAEVIWDRRVRDRRVIIRDMEVDRRRGERRAPLDATLWTTRGYILARLGPPASRPSAGGQEGVEDAPEPLARRRPSRRRTGRR